jgi:hypothetical protein
LNALEATGVRQEKGPADRIDGACCETLPSWICLSAPHSRKHRRDDVARLLLAEDENGVAHGAALYAPGPAKAMWPPSRRFHSRATALCSRS